MLHKITETYKKMKTMMQIKHLFAAAVVLLAPTVLSGCESKDGDWDPIRYSVNDEVCPKKPHDCVYDAPAEGGTFRIGSSNYGSMFWPVEVCEGDRKIWPENYDSSDFRNLHLENDWYDVQYDVHGYLVVVLEPKPADAPSRSLKFQIECGDAFGKFTLRQN